MVLPDSHQMLVSCATRELTRIRSGFRLQVFHPLWMCLPALSTNLSYTLYCKSHNPYKNCFLWFGLFRFRSPLLSKSLVCFLFLKVLRWFNSLRSLSYTMYSYKNICLRRWVAPFGHYRVIALLTAHRYFSQSDTSFFAS